MESSNKIVEDFKSNKEKLQNLKYNILLDKKQVAKTISLNNTLIARAKAGSVNLNDVAKMLQPNQKKDQTDHTLIQHNNIVNINTVSNHSNLVNHQINDKSLYNSKGLTNCNTKDKDKDKEKEVLN